MNKSLSLYLDLFRFLAAMVVFLSHYASQQLTGGFLWQFKVYDQTAVMIFFVMSGFVIAFVTCEREKDFKSYAIARLARLYSIIIPALILTATLDFIGIQLNEPLYYQASWPYPDSSQLVHYVLSFFMIQNVWDLQLNPGINGPFWSLTFEWFYYLIFAAFFFVRSNTKYLLILVLCLIGGPTIVALLPIWFAGYLLYYAMQKQKNTSFFKVLICVAALLMLIILGPYVRDIQTESEWIARGALWGDYFDAIVFCVHLYCAPSLLRYTDRFLFPFEKVIRWTASLTFALYLFHRPIIQAIAAIHDADVSNWTYRIVMLVITLTVVAVVGRWCEKYKKQLKIQINKLWK